MQCKMTFQAKYDIYVRGIKCKHFDPEIVRLERCVVKAERGRKGVIYGVATMIKPVDRIWVIVCVSIYVLYLNVQMF